MYRVLLVFEDSKGGREYGHHREYVSSGSNGSEQGKGGFLGYIRAPQEVEGNMGTTEMMFLQAQMGVNKVRMDYSGILGHHKR